MMNNVVSTADLTDAELAADALNGSREAFGMLVDRYKSLICSIAYSATGNLSQSEDLAQETFVTAWKNLSQLREREKLRSWLCGIARNTVNNAIRRERRQPLSRAEDLESLANSAAPGPLPSERAITAEEQTLLWRTLEQIPETYREPLVLYYREGASVERVAQALEISEDAVKQRMSRGRKLLSEQMATFVEGVLRQSAPGRAFTFAVLASLPALPLTASAATVGAAAAAKGTAAAHGVGLLTILSAIAGPLAGILGAWFGTKASLDSARSEEERQFIWKQVRRTAITIVSFLTLVLAVSFTPGLKQNPTLFACLQAVLWIGYSAVLLFLIVQYNRGHQRIRKQSPAAEHTQKPWRCEYKSAWSFLGLPLLHVSTGSKPGGGPSVARGWIALGDIATGFIAMGGFAFGVFAMGGMAAGVFCLGGVGLGVAAFAGVAGGYWVAAGMGIGVYAFGGSVIAWKVAMGGVAVARDFAVGGLASAAHANDALARAAVTAPFFVAAQRMVEYCSLLVWLPIGFVILQTLQRKKRQGTRANG